MMEMKTLFSIILLVTLVHVDARLGVEPTVMNPGNMASYTEIQSQNSICGSCLEASKKAEKALDELELLEEIEMLSSRVCLSLPSDFKHKCLEKSGVYISQTKMLVQDMFHEDNLCRSTGLCSDESTFPSKNAVASDLNSPPELEECFDCRRAVKDIFSALYSPRMMKKIKQILFEYCEEIESEKRCEMTINKYVPMIMLELQRMRSEKMCGMIGYCGAGKKQLSEENI